ncbi:MAG: hypothetical protein ABI846_10645 [Rudaea sp.]
MPASRQSFYIGIPDLAVARGKIDALSFTGSSADTLAAELQAALRQPDLWERWKALQPDPDGVDPALGASDPQATVTAQQSDLHCDAEIVTVLPHALIRHRLGLLIGAHWTLRDVRAA